MPEGKLEDVKKLAGKFEVSTKGSKLDIINRVKECIGNDHPKFLKIFWNNFLDVQVSG